MNTAKQSAVHESVRLLRFARETAGFEKTERVPSQQTRSRVADTTKTEGRRGFELRKNPSVSAKIGNQFLKPKRGWCERMCF